MKTFNNNEVIIQDPKEVAHAYKRIKDYLIETPIITCELLNKKLGHEIYFKIESLQKTGAFKVRGVLNHLLALKESNNLPSHVVAYSTGNHGLGLAWAANLLNIKARIYLPLYTSTLKQKFAEIYGAEVIYTENRIQAEEKSFEDKQNGYYYLHPSDSDLTIAGAGTLCYEALKKVDSVDTIFASIGGGGLISGSYLAKELISPSSLLIGAEPVCADDAYKSVKEGKIFRFDNSPETFADGLKTLGVSKRTFEYLKKLDDIYLVEEDKIAYWTFWLAHLLKVYVEPSAAINMDAGVKWLKTQNSPKKILILLSGGNIDPSIFKSFTSSIVDNNPL